ncbi:MGMT family protein [Gordonia hydrophobica]|uniref:MGMT family protein n=1 Tax=Gordonia hydrophobica TaxID=40516 RepID=A0ABZ2TX70_9ACTN|nr:MGMT family protein [Gordonia hydrophobica]MBM7366215.1 methylated-DNA-[protein]-cysteine S-methyltransferase [Gordonia hydrophobica]
MAKVTEDQVEQVRALIAAIPPGMVSTYGDLASVVGLSSPRIVGWIMRTDAADLPWHRVVPVSGRPAAGLRARQLARLRDEGVHIDDDRIDMKTHRVQW